MDRRLGPTLSCLVAGKSEFPNQLLFCHNNKACWSSQEGEGGGQGGEAEEVEVEEGWTEEEYVVKEDVEEVEEGYVKNAEGDRRILLLWQKSN